MHPPPSSDSRFWRFAFVIVMLLECSPLWVYRYFPSQDGPSHLHNASVLAHYGSELIYQQYYRRMPSQPGGNMIAQFILAGLLKFTGPARAEQLLLSGYVILLFLSFRYLLKGLTPNADHFSLFAGILVSNYFLYMGFWNYCYSVCFLLFMLGYYVRQKSDWTLRSLAMLGAMGFLVYLTHVVSWVIGVIAVGILGLERLVNEIWGLHDTTPVKAQRATLQYDLSICTLLPPAFFILFFLTRSRGTTECDVMPESVRTRLWHLYNLTFLDTITPSDLIIAKTVAVALFLALIFAVVLSLRQRRYNWRSTGMLVLSATFVALSLAAPDCVSSGSYIRLRVSLYACLFFVVWLSMQNWPRLALNIFAALWCGIALIGLAARYPVLSDWNKKLSGVALLGENIRPQSTVLMLNCERSIWPNAYKHSVGFLSARNIVDLRNYEASMEYFSTEFRPERSPFPALGTLKELESVPSRFDIPRYEKQTQGRVDYIIFEQQAPANSGGKLLEEKLYGNQLANYRLLSSADGGKLRLYARAANNTPGNASPRAK